jgi:hypothetical protein
MCLTKIKKLEKEEMKRSFDQKERTYSKKIVKKVTNNIKFKVKI